MTFLIYRLGVRLYTLVVHIASHFVPKAALWVKGRKNWANKLEAALDKKRPVLWFHAASLGEFEQGRPIIEELAKKHPQHQILVTFFSPSGYEVRKNYKGAQHVTYLPADTAGNVKRFLDLARPEIAVFVKYEFWFGYLKALRNRSIPHFVVAANFRTDQLFFKWYGQQFLKALKAFSHIFVQREASLALLAEYGISNATVCGDTRFDRVWQTANAMEPVEGLDAFSMGSFVVIGGSTWPEEEAFFIHIINNTNLDLKYIVAPHEIKEERIASFMNEINLPSARYFKSTPEEIAQARVLIVDGIGMLSRMYRYGDLALVGGGFGTGIHNILEAATFGIPVFFGPRHHKFPEAKELIARGAGFEVRDSETFKAQVEALVEDITKFKVCKKAARAYVKEHTGPSAKISSMLSDFLPSE